MGGLPTPGPLHGMAGQGRFPGKRGIEAATGAPPRGRRHLSSWGYGGIRPHHISSSVIQYKKGVTFSCRMLVTLRYHIRFHRKSPFHDDKTPCVRPASMEVWAYQGILPMFGCESRSCLFLPNMKNKPFVKPGGKHQRCCRAR